MAEKQETALGVLIQKLGEVLQPIGDFSKQLDSMVEAGLGGLWEVAATVLLVEEVNKLTFGQQRKSRPLIKCKGS